jgi:hypothetical protein
MSTMGHTSSKLTAIRAILSAAPLCSRSHLYRWGRLDQGDLKRLVQELEDGGHVVDPNQLYQLRYRLYELDMVEFSHHVVRIARTNEENRYAADHEPESPSYPKRTRLGNPHFVCLEDGRIARRIDLTRAIPLCGLRSPVLMTEIERRANAQDGISRVRWITGSIKCTRCDGYHLSPAKPVEPSGPTVTSEVMTETCRHCGASSLVTEWVGTAQYGFGDRRCLICGWYQLETFNLMPQDVLLRNQEALTRAMVHTVTETQEDGIEVNEETDDLHIVGDLDQLDPVRNQGVTSVDGEMEDMVADGLTSVDLDASDDLLDPGDRSNAGDETHAQDESGLETDEYLVSMLNRLWKDKSCKALRCALLERSLENPMDPERLDLVWTVASVLADSSEDMTFAQQQEVATWLLGSSDEDLRNLLPPMDLARELTMEKPAYILPPVSGKITQWKRACRNRLARFQYPRAGAHILAPSFGVSERAFLAAVGL